MFSKKLYISFGLLLLYILVFFLKERFTVGLYQDENHYLPTAALFATEPLPSIHLLQTYNELNTPIPFILGGWVIRIFGEDIQNLRLLTFVTSFALLLVFVWSSPAISKRFWVSLAGLLIFPNFYLCSVYYYTDIFAMVFVLAGVAFYIRKIHGAGMLMLALGVACRQYMLAFPAAIAAFELFGILAKSGNVKMFFNKLFSERTWMFYAAAVLSIVPWIILWKGPAPAPVMAEQYYDSDKVVQYNFGYLMYASVVVAVYHIIPDALLSGKLKSLLALIRNNYLLTAVFSMIAIAIVVFFPAKQAYNPYFTWPYLGYVDELLEKLHISGIIKQVIFGALMLLTLTRFLGTRMSLAGWMLLINILLLGKAQLSWDKYSLPLIMVLWFLAMFDKQWWNAKPASPAHANQ